VNQSFLQSAIASGVLTVIVVTPPAPLAAGAQQPVQASASRESDRQRALQLEGWR
jgi:hypothetical protein